MPLSAAEVMGSIDELQLMQQSFGESAVMDATVEEIMAPALNTIGVGQPVSMAVDLLATCRALLVLDGGRPRSVISRSDVLSFLSHGG